MVLYVLIEHIGYRLRAELIEFAVHRGQRKNLSTLAEAFPSLSLVIFGTLSYPPAKHSMKLSSRPTVRLAKQPKSLSKA